VVEFYACFLKNSEKNLSKFQVEQLVFLQSFGQNLSSGQGVEEKVFHFSDVASLHLNCHCVLYSITPGSTVVLKVFGLVFTHTYYLSV
jgi:hypothetical protein